MSEPITLAAEQVQVITGEFADLDPTLLMAYGYAFGRLDACEPSEKFLISAPGVGNSESFTAAWFAHLYRAQQGLSGYGHEGSWAFYVWSGGRAVYGDSAERAAFGDWRAAR